MKNGGDQGDPLRPLIDKDFSEHKVSNMMNECWAEDPSDRPDFNHLKQIIRKLNK